MDYTTSIVDEIGLSNIWDGQKYINPDFFTKKNIMEFISNASITNIA
jgi:hypothetical protein